MRSSAAGNGPLFAIGVSGSSCTDEAASKVAQDNGIDMQIVKLPEVKKGFVLQPLFWVVERRFSWLATFRLANFLSVLSAISTPNRPR